MKEKPSKKERLEHMSGAIDRIKKFVKGMSIEDFNENEMAQYAVIKNFEILGEAAYQLPKEFRLEHDSKIEWRKIMALRHILVHDYYKINKEIVWNTIHDKLDDLKIELQKLIEE